MDTKPYNGWTNFDTWKLLTVVAKDPNLRWRARHIARTMLEDDVKALIMGDVSQWYVNAGIEMDIKYSNVDWARIIGALKFSYVR